MFHLKRFPNFARFTGKMTVNDMFTAHYANHTE